MRRLSPEQHYRLILLQEERERRRLIRRIKRREDKNKYTPHHPSSFINYLIKNNFIVEPRHQFEHNYAIKICPEFSLLTENDQSLKVIARLVKAIADPNLKSIIIDHSECKSLDLDASSIMDVIILEAIKVWTKENMDINLSGYYSLDENVNEKLKTSGIVKHLKHQDSEVPEEVKKKYDVFTLVTGQKEKNISAFQSTQVEIISTKITDYFNRLLGKVGYCLTRDGKKNLSNLVSEVLDNAEQHSSSKKWHVSGFLDENNIFNLTIFDFGDTISKTLGNAKLNRKLKNNINTLLKKHATKGFFRFKNVWDRSNLWTLFALQEGISRFNTEYAVSDRGQGTVRLIDFFLELASNKSNLGPQMVIISGNTYILFDGKYRLRSNEIDGESRQIIAFNDSNDLSERPDSKYVKNIKFSFPGTIISMKFAIDKEYLDDKFKGVTNGK
jgi:hypothetical protein